VKGPADIKGMKFGVTAPGSSTHMLLNFWAAKGGLKASDVVAIGVGAGASVIAAVEKGEVDGVSQTDPALTILTDKNLVKVVVDTRTTKGNQEVFGGAFPAASLYSQSDFIKKNPGTTQALATGIVRANQWLQAASPADVANAVPEGYLLGDRTVYEKSFAGVRETISPDGTMPAGAMENCLKFLAESDPAIKPAAVKLADTWNNEFAQRAAKRS
jgi:NitT/TauT family transport system substrate-binding protein